MRTRAVSWYAAVVGVAASVGLVLGGVLAQSRSWRVQPGRSLETGKEILGASFR